jgi:hypothetical protein
MSERSRVLQAEVEKLQTQAKETHATVVATEEAAAAAIRREATADEAARGYREAARTVEGAAAEVERLQTMNEEMLQWIDASEERHKVTWFDGAQRTGCES